jgi:hypothetical protein
MTMSTTATKTYFARIVWGATQQEWVFTCDEAQMQEIRSAMLQQRPMSVTNNGIETLLNPAHISKLEFQPSGN